MPRNVEDRNYSYNNSLNAVINTAISHFNAIHDALAVKGIAGYTENATGRPTANYATDIRNHLFKISGKTQEQVGVHILPDNSASTFTIDTTSVVYDGNKVILSGAGLPLGYYNTGSTIRLSMTGTGVNASGALTSAAGWDLNDGGTAYIYDKTNKVINSLSIAKANLSVSSNALTLVANSTSGAASGIANTDLSISSSDVDQLLNEGAYATLIASDASEANNYYDIALTSTLTATGGVSTHLYPTLTTAGYVGAQNEIGVTDITTNFGATGLNLTGTLSRHLYLRKAVVNLGTSTGGALSVTNTDGILVTSIETGTDSNYYAITSSVTAASFPNAQVTEGYTTGESLTVGVSDKTQTVYIPKGNISNGTKDVNITVSSADNIPLNYSGADKVTFGIAPNLTKTELALTTGYQAGKTVEVTYSNSGATAINIQKAAGALIGTGFDAELTGTPLTEATGVMSTDDYYTITSAISGSLSIDGSNSHGGYLKASEFATAFTGSVSNVAGTTYYVLKGKDTSGVWTGTPTFGAASGGGYAVSINASHVVPAGYYPEQHTVSYSGSYSIPKATLVWQESEGEGRLYVNGAGYLESGESFVFGGGSGQIGGEAIASVKATLSTTTGSDIVIGNSTLPTAGTFYQISLTKDATTNAGYISAGTGTLSFASDYYYYILKGSYSATYTASASAGAPTWDSGSSKFKSAITVSNTGPSNSTLNPGYIASASEINITATKSDTSLDLGLGAISATGEVTLAKDTTLSNVQTVTSSSKQIVVTATGTATPQVTGAGYVDTSHATISTNAITTVGNNLTLKVKEGSVAQTLLTGTLTPSFDPSTRVVSITGAANLTGSTVVSEGYVDANSQGVGLASSQPNFVLGTYTIPAGRVAINGSGSAEATSSVNDVIHASQTTGHVYIPIDITGTFSASSGTITPGYISQSTDVTGISGQSLSSTTRYIEKFVGTGTTGTSQNPANAATYTPSGSNSEETVWYYTIGASDDGYGELYIPTKNKFADQNIVVDLDDNAAGQNVITDLTRLQQRLAGELARSGS